MPAYEIVSSQQVQAMTKAGTTQTFYRVSIRTERGSTGDLDVAERDWNAEKLRELLDVFAEKLDLAFMLPEE
jgi:hypothetical protein